MNQTITNVGMDVHKKTISVCMLIPGQERPLEWQVLNTAKDVKRLAKAIRAKAVGEVLACYEAGPCGFALLRQLQELEIKAHVIAPSLIPTKPGDHIKTDRRDARKLAELDRAGLLTDVHPPTPEDEALRPAGT